ncbi:MAG: prefoldin subunit [Candidatus Pacearchaeota archaeon]
MEVDQETGKKIQSLQILEQNFQNIILQKQTFQIEINEILTAINEIGKTKSDVFRVIGQIMVKSDKASLNKELGEKKKILDLKVKSVEKQELEMKEEIERLRAEIMNKLK